MVAVETQERASQCLPERLTRKFTTYLTFLLQWYLLSIVS